MNTQELINTAKAMVAGDKGLLAMDESNTTCNKRFAALGIPQTEEARRAYREMIITTSGLSESISGVILYDETIHQKLTDGTPFIKAAIAKWRAVIAIGENIPDKACIEANAHALARYAALCQETGLVPIVEPEVLMTGNHSLKQCLEATGKVLHAVFQQLYIQGIMLEGMILKPNMVVPGLNCPTQESVDEVADTTVKCLLRAVPAAVPGVAFLSGGQSAEVASARLSAMNVRFKGQLPWALTFSFSRAIQQPALDIWLGKKENVPEAQKALYHRANCNRAARSCKYNAAMEKR